MRNKTTASGFNKDSPKSKGRAPLSSEDWYEKLYSMLLESIPSSILLVDRSLRVVAANRNFLEKARRSEEDTIGAPIREIFPGAILEYTRLEVKVRGVFDTGLALHGAQMTYRAPGVPTRIYYYTVVPVKLAGTVENAMILMDDITEKVHLIEKTRVIERHLASVVESANDIVVSTDSDGRIISWNTAGARICGYRTDEVRGMLLADLCEATHRELMTRVIQQLVRGEAVKSQELNLIARSGKLVPVAWSCSAMRDESGTVKGMVAVGRDLSERRAFEAQLLQSEKLGALGVMAGGIAHELRNPLSVSFSAAQFLLEDPSDPVFRQDCIRKIMSGIQRSTVIIEGLLRFAKPTDGDRMEPLDLRSVARETVQLLAPQAKLQKVAVDEEYEAAPVPVMGNASLLQQVFMNVILNACQGMPDGGALRIEVKREAAEAVARLRDTGRGIARANLGKIFDPFFTTRPSGKGTGLGLSICYTIVKQHGGLITADSTGGRGSTFTIRLPLKAIDS